MPASLSPDIEAQAISLIRGFAMDAPLHAKSGHQGTAMALAPLAHVLYSRVLKHDPTDPSWPDRDRFVLSNGHASILQYSMLYLCGYGLELDDIKAFRSFGSLTPGHPEAAHTIGIEVTTGPLGQGFGDSVGMAIAERVLRDRFGPQLVDHHTYVIAGDGCLMEGISHEAASLAGHLGLGRLICVFDDNRVTIDGPTTLSCTDDVGERFAAYGWNVEYLGEIADDCDALEAALLAARADEDRPSLLVLRSHIGHPSPDHTDDHEAHGNPFTPEEASRTKAVMGIPDEPFWSPPELVAAYRAAAAERCAEDRARWAESLDGLDSEERAAWDAAWDGTGIKGWEQALPTFEQGEKIATRQAIAKVLGACVPTFPGLVSGAADLTGNTGTKLPDAVIQSADTPGGRQIYYGIREHAMGAALVGMARHGGIVPVGGTFFVFLDYMREPVRLASLSRAKAIFIFSHDSVGVGEDGPTHQPVEHLATLRAVPGLQVIRPADANETVAAWRAAIDHDGPTAIVLTRQGVRVCTDGSAVERGAGAVHDNGSPPSLVIVATGSEVALAIDAAERLDSEGIGDACREPAQLGPAGAAGRRLPALAPARWGPRVVGRGRHHVRLGAVRRRFDRHRPVRRQRSRGRRARRVGHQRRPRPAAGAGPDPLVAWTPEARSEF